MCELLRHKIFMKIYHNRSSKVWIKRDQLQQCFQIGTLALFKIIEANHGPRDPENLHYM